MFKLKKLDVSGISHLMIPLVIMVLVGLVGTYLIVGSHADAVRTTTVNAGQPCPPGYYRFSQVGNKITCKNLSDAQKLSPKSNATTATHAPVTDAQSTNGNYGCPAGYAYSISRTCQKIIHPSSGGSGGAHTAPTNSGDQEGNAIVNVPPTVTASNPDPAPVASAATYATVKHSDPRGDIVIASYVNDAANPKADNALIGGLNVSISRDGGGADCLTHKTGKGQTSQSKSVKHKNGTKIYGTVTFLNCKAGKYTVTTTGRSGYTLLSKKTKSFTLSDKENQRVSFVIQKDAVKTSRTGGVQAPSR